MGILFEIFAGESAKASAGGNVTVAVRQSYNNMRIIVSCGWAIYPAGYFLGQVNTTAGAAEALNVTYNIADFVNKIALVLACWSCAKSDTERERLLPYTVSTSRVDSFFLGFTCDFRFW